MVTPPKSSSKKSSSSKKESSKKPSSSSKEKSSSKSSSKSKLSPSPSASDVVKEKPTVPQEEPGAPGKGSPDFEAGLLFERYAGKHGGGGIDAQDFQKMWREKGAAMLPPPSVPPVGPEVSFEVGQLFERYNTGRDGRLTRAEFERLVGDQVAGRYQQQQPFVFPPQKSPQHEVRVPQQQQEAERADTFAKPLLHSHNIDDQARRPGAYDFSGVQVGPPLTHYNETTGVPLPHEAVAPQAALGHTIVPLHEAYNRRLSRLQALVSSRLMPAREQLLQFRRRLMSCSEEVKAAKNSVSRETESDAEAILERLRSAEALKQATLTQRVNHVAAEINALDKIAQKVAGVAALGDTSGYSTRHVHEYESTGKMIELIQSYSDLCGAVEKAANKPHDANVGVLANDFPHETAERLEVVRRADRYEKALAIKDQIIWNLMQENGRMEEKAAAEAALSAEYANEMSEWVELTNRLGAQVEELRAEATESADVKEECARLRDRNRLLEAELGKLTSDLHTFGIEEGRRRSFRVQAVS